MASGRVTDNEILAQIPAASRRAVRARGRQPHAAAVRLDTSPLMSRWAWSPSRGLFWAIGHCCGQRG